MSNLINGYVAVRVAFRATNLIKNNIYYNTALSSGEIGTGLTKVAVVDSSNNGDQTAIDPNADGDAGEVTENKPTPYFFGMILPIKFIDVTASRINTGQHLITWTIAPPESPLEKFIVEYSEDNINWKTAGSVAAFNTKYSYALNYIPNDGNTIYYRVRAYESGGNNYVSQQVVVKKIAEVSSLKISPNPADKYISVSDDDDNFTTDRKIYIIDVNGKKIFEQSFINKYIELNMAIYPSGLYIVDVVDKGSTSSIQVLVKHP